MRILAFDLSRHTGWAVMDGPERVDSGFFEVKIAGWKSDISKTDQFPPQFPGNFETVIEEIVEKCKDLVARYKPDLVVTEFIEGSSRRFSQLFLDWIHLDFYRCMKAIEQPFKYMLNSDWRNHCRCYVSQHPEVKKYNAQVGKAKRKAVPNAVGAKVAKIDGKVVSRINQKKLLKIRLLIRY